MSYYRLKNITSSLPKRHQNNNTDIKIEYLVGFQKKIHVLPVSQELVFACKSLPIQIHTLRAKKLITVIEIGENEFTKLQKPNAKKNPIVEVEKSEKPKKVKKEILDEISPKKKESPKKKSSSTAYLTSDSE